MRVAKFSIGVAILLLLCEFSLSRSIFGKWKTFDDKTGEARSIVEIYEKDGQVFGVIRRLLVKPPDTRCTKCEGEDKDKLVIGMNIIKNMEEDKDEYAGGTITDPKNGKVYTCKLWLDKKDENKLNVRGYILFLFRTQHWKRVSE